MNSVHPHIITSRAAIANSAVSQGADHPAQICGYADPAPLSPQEAQRLAMLLLPAILSVAVPRVQRPPRPEETKGGRLDIRV